MGCKTCKMGDQQQTGYDSFYKERPNAQNNTGLLTIQDKQIWLDNLSEPNQPDPNFWINNYQGMHTCFSQIKKDIARSFPNSQFFSSKANIQRFETLLKKFALYFPKVGYTQGINFLAGYILIAGFDDQNAFKILVRITLNQKLMMIGLYQDKFPLNRLYCALFWKLLETRQKNTAIKIKLANVLDEIWIFQWFMTFFLYSFPVTFVKRFFDYVICKKQFALVTLALGIVNCLKSDITNLKDPDQFQFFQFFDQLKNIEFCEAKINIDKVINYANSVTKHEISKALQELKFQQKNMYYIYFTRENKNESWSRINEKFSYQRRMYKSDPQSSQYIRDQRSVEHLERLLLRKSRLYRSRTDSRFSSQIRTSNYTIDLEGEDIKSEVLDQPQHQRANPHNMYIYEMNLHEYQKKLQHERQLQQKNLKKNNGVTLNQGYINSNYIVREQSTSGSKDSRNLIGRYP